MARHKSRAFIISAADYRETSRLIHLFCENEGRISLIAKGLRSPKSKKATAAEPFSLVQVTYILKEGETLGLLTGIETERIFPGMRARLESYALASYWFEIVRTAAQARLASPEFFGLTESFLESLEGAEDLTELSAWHFGRLLQALGFGADLEACGRCGTEKQLEHFDPALGATVCVRCAEPRHRYLPLARESAGLLSPLFSGRRPDSTAPLAAQARLPFFLILNELLTIHLDQTLRSFQFVKDVVGRSLRVG